MNEESSGIKAVPPELLFDLREEYVTIAVLSESAARGTALKLCVRGAERIDNCIWRQERGKSSKL